MKIFCIIILLMINYKNGDSLVQLNLVQKTQIKSIPKNKYCYFFEKQLYNKYEIQISQDTISILHNGVLEKTWFGQKNEEFLSKEYNIKSIPKTKFDDKKLFFRLNGGTPKIKYTALSNDLKKKFSELGLNIDYHKIQRFEELYFFIKKNDTAQYPSIFIYNAKFGKVDTIKWNGSITEDKIEDFFLYDFKKDGYIDLFIFSKDTIHEGGYGITAITSSPNWNCSNK